MSGTIPSQVVEESRDDKMEEKELENKANIVPPENIRCVVEKTTKFVAKNGPEFEQRIIANNAGNALFNFLNASDPYHAYYQHHLAKARSQNQAADSTENASSTA